MRIAVQTGRQAVLETCRAVLAHGRDVAGTRELIGFTVEIADPTDTMATGIGHVDFRPVLAVAEAAYLWMGAPYGEWIQGITADLESRRWTEAPELNYGMRLREQMPAILRKLETDPDTRQAVGLVWRETDLEAGFADFLCTTQVQFLLRGGALHMIVTMRSNDAWHGLPYNLYQWSRLQRGMARCLNVSCGTYVHQVGSMHLYERHWDKAAALHDPVGA